MDRNQNQDNNTAQDPNTAATAQDPNTAATAQDPNTAATAQDPNTAATGREQFHDNNDVMRNIIRFLEVRNFEMLFQANNHNLQNTLAESQIFQDYRNTTEGRFEKIRVYLTQKDAQDSVAKQMIRAAIKVDSDVLRMADDEGNTINHLLAARGFNESLKALGFGNQDNPMTPPRITRNNNNLFPEDLAQNDETKDLTKSGVLSVKDPASAGPPGAPLRRRATRRTLFMEPNPVLEGDSQRPGAKREREEVGAAAEEPKGESSNGKEARREVGSDSDKRDSPSPEFFRDDNGAGPSNKSPSPSPKNNKSDKGKSPPRGDGGCGR